MKIVKLLLAITAVFVLLLMGALYFANRYVQSAEFKAQVTAAAHAALGADVQIADMHVALFSGATLKGIAIANPPGFNGKLLTADAFVVRYRLWPLLKERLEIEEISAQKPVIVLTQNTEKQWNYKELGGKESPKAEKPSSEKPTATQPAATASPVDVVLSRLAMVDGVFAMVDDNGDDVVRVDKINLSTSIDMTAGKLTGAGKSSIGTINAANAVFLREVKAPVTITPEQVKLAPLTAKLADGTVAGEIAVAMQDFGYTLHLTIKDADMAKFLQEAGQKPVMTGQLQTVVDVTGTGGLETMAGKGRAEITGGALGEIPLVNLIATVLQLPELRAMKFDECVVEFSLTNNVMQTPVIRMRGDQVSLTGAGTVNLEDNTLNHELKLALGKELMAKIPPMLQTAFKPNADGVSELEFRVWGPYNAPKTDIAKKFVSGIRQQLLDSGIQKGLKNLFK